MTRRSPLVVPVAIAVAIAAFTSARLAEAQYRPPPPTEAQQLLQEGDSARTEAAAAEARGDRKAADAAYGTAATAYAKALKLDGSLQAAAAGLGACWNALKQWAKTVESVRAFADAHPEANDVAFPVGVALMKLGRGGEAAPYLERVVASGESQYFMARYYRGLHALQTNDGSRAVEELTRFLEVRPKELAGGDPQIYELVGRAELSRRRAAEARAAFERAQKGRPESVSVQLGLASVLELEGRQKEAVKLVEGLVARQPKSIDARDRLVRLLIATGELARAEKAAEELLAVQTSPATLVLLGDVLLQRDKAAPAEQRYRQALAASPGYVVAEIGVGRALERQGKYDDARALLEKASAAAPNDPQLWAALGSTYRRANRYEKAVAAHEKVVKLLPTSAQGHLLLGADHFATGEWDEAVRDYSTALKIDPPNARARHLLAMVLTRRAQAKVRRNLFDEAVLDLRRAYDVERTPEIGRTLAAILLQSKQFAEAERITDELVKEPSPSWTAWLLRGYTLLGLGKAADAVSAFEAAGKATSDGAAASDVSLGWALAKIELGEYEAAIARLREVGGPAAEIGRTNLPLALVKLGWRKLEAGDVAGATKDLETARSFGPKGPVASAAQLLHALILVEARKYGAALEEVKAAFPGGRATWAEPAARPLVEAYIHYRAGQVALARKQLAAAKRSIPAASAAWVARLTNALSEREARELVGRGELVPAEALLRKLLAAEPNNPVLQHNLAVVQHRRGDAARAVATWQQLESAVPEALYNLGVDEEVRKHQPRAAAALYQRYLASQKGGGSAERRELKESVERMQRIYGGGAP
jgi:tetratricopeptide (TPR) repeat protein